HLAAQQKAEAALAQLEEKLRVALETSSREIAALQGEVTARASDLEAIKRERDALRTQADRVPHLRNELDEREAENRRRFEIARSGIGPCSRGGALGRFNGALVRPVGYRTADELRRVDFAARVFESAAEFRALTEQCLTSRRTESVETKWRKRDGRRIAVRVL